jgi:hypothetical protein
MLEQVQDTLISNSCRISTENLSLSPSQLENPDQKDFSPMDRTLPRSYAYQDLDKTRRQIRLVKLKPDSGTIPLSCELITVSLDDNNEPFKV